MAEPSSTLVASATAAGITLATFAGLDANTLIGATAGASLFVMSAKDLRLPTRIAYLLISLCMGYLGGPAVLGHLFSEPAVSAFVFSACVIVTGLRLIKSVDEIDLKHWFKK